MSEGAVSDVGKLIVDLLVANERFQFALKCFKTDISDSIYLLYASAVKLINGVVDVDKRQCRMFRLKYHHILSNESIEEYLYHCLSKILSEVLDQETSYQRFIQPVAELHMKLMSIVSQVQLKHREVVCANRKVRHEVQKNQNSHKSQSIADGAISPTDEEEASFQPVYYLPSVQSCARLKRAQYLTFQAINKHYTDNEVDFAMTTMLIDFDRSFADFELDFVCQVNKTSIVSARAAEMTMDVAVMFCEAVRWAHSGGLLRYGSISDCEIEAMVGVPRLAVLYGCGVAREGPLSEAVLLRPGGRRGRTVAADEERLAPVFRGHMRALGRLRRQVAVLAAQEMRALCRLLLAPEPASLPSKEPLVLSGDVHALFKTLAAVADQMQSEHASDYRFFMEVVYKQFKDETDDLEGPRGGVVVVRSLSSPDLAVEEAVEAVSYLAEVRLPSRSLADIRTVAEGALKALPLPAEATPIGLARRPQWQEDRCCPCCCHCGLRFTVLRRRHHCRRCGYLFCGGCWGARLPLPGLGIRAPVPVCVECRDFLAA